MRAFLAVVPPPDVIDDLLHHLQPRRDADAADGSWRWTEPDHLHLTLAFMADLPEHREDDLVAAAEAWGRRQRPCRMALGRAGAFPDPGAAKVLWVGVEEEDARQTLSTWARQLRDVAAHHGARPDGKRFRAHVTVARSGRPRAAARVAQALDGYRSAPFEVSEVVLVCSHLGQGPRRAPRYEQRARVTLGPQDPDPPTRQSQPG